MPSIESPNTQRHVERKEQERNKQSQEAVLTPRGRAASPARFTLHEKLLKAPDAPVYLVHAFYAHNAF